MSSKKPNPSSRNDLMRYAGLGGQLLVSLGLAVFVGYKGDQWLHLRFPVLVLLLPLVVLCGIIYKLVKDTSKQKPDDAEKRA